MAHNLLTTYNEELKKIETIQEELRTVNQQIASMELEAKRSQREYEEWCAENQRLKSEKLNAQLTLNQEVLILEIHNEEKARVLLRRSEEIERAKKIEEVILNQREQLCDQIQLSIQHPGPSNVSNLFLEDWSTSESEHPTRRNN
ncbi:uncharacterized protein LOC108252217 [Diaphorina citri]|uniref:Uncharacterized protein LOC108252217 n=1 Tax=Diaphorina citri TaxID=121845 RepID=A0A3Q0IQA9_DIACI|nr:uncharacterized protein LOC108252217 [Diaphorina citri]